MAAVALTVVMIGGCVIGVAFHAIVVACVIEGDVRPGAGVVAVRTLPWVVTGGCVPGMARQAVGKARMVEGDI